MEPAVRARAGARDAVADVTPHRLCEVILEVLEEGAMTPGALTVLSAQAVEDSTPADGPGPTDDSTPADVSETSVESRAAGVQLIYEGLALTRSLAHEEPWAIEEELLDSDLAILAADVMVSQGFFLLARTEAAVKAVDTVRSFGHDQTVQRATDDGETYALEADVFELAVVAGTSTAGVEAPTFLREYAVDLAHSLNGAPTPEVPASLPDQIGEAIASLSTRRKTLPADEPARSWATDP